MRFVIFATIVCFCVVGALAESTKFENLLDTCTEKLNADPKAVKAAYDEGKTDDPEVKCVLACTMQEDGVMSEDGAVDKGKMLAVWSIDAPLDIKDKVIEAINECGDEQNEDKCENAYQIYNCIYLKLESAEE